MTPAPQSSRQASVPAAGRLRVEPGRPPLHPWEAALVGVTALHLCFLPWALGTMHVWSQLTSLGFSLLGFGLVMLPRNGTDEFSTGEMPAARLLRFPVFWAGLAMLGYVAAQGLNPAWRYLHEADAWWIEPISHLSWLPSGVAAPYDISNPWRALTIYGSLWLLVCSVWAGLLRRKSYLALFTLLSVNAFLLAMLGVLQKLRMTDRIFWSYLPSNESFTASFIYHNHAGAYLNLMVALATGLACWHYQRAYNHLQKPGLSVVFTLFAGFIGLTVIFSYSRMSIILLLAFTLLTVGVFVFRLFRRSGRVWDRKEFLPLALALAGFVGVGLVSLRTDKVWERFADAEAHPVATARSRALVRAAAGEMLRDRWLLGWGAGCFRFNFTHFARKYPDIYYYPGDSRQYWEHAHDDLLEFPIEFGA
ncbi:MAG: O-antigen ligase family protein, partial [Opitutaceae bacterium]